MLSSFRPRWGKLGLAVAGSIVLWAASVSPANAGSFRGDMLVANDAGSDVLAFDPVTGAYRGIFVRPGQGRCSGGRPSSDADSAAKLWSCPSSGARAFIQARA
jgi:hypothetical protein